MSTFTNGYRNTIKIEMNRSDKNRFKHFNFLVKFDLLFLDLLPKIWRQIWHRRF